MMKALVVVLIGLLTFASCSGGGVSFEFFVVIKPSEATKFVREVTTIANKAGLETAEAQAVADTGTVLKVVEGRGHGVKLWVQNVLLSGREDPKLCGVPVRVEPYPDPAQFAVSTEPRFFGSKMAAKELGERMLSQLQNSGFEVRREAIVCGAAVLHDRS